MITEHRNDRCLVTGLGFSCGHSRSSKPIVSIGSGSLANDERTIIHETRPRVQPVLDQLSMPTLYFRSIVLAKECCFHRANAPFRIDKIKSDGIC